MEKKTFEFEFKDISEEGTFSGYLSTFGNVDQGGDVVEAGAFKKTLKDNKSFVFLWAHQGTIDAIVGSFTGKEDEHGLLINGDFFLNLEAGMKAYRTTRTLKEKGVRVGLSMGYKVVKDAYDTVDNATIRRLKEVRLIEGSGTLWPMNEQATLDSIKEDADEEGAELKPYPNEHSCRLNDPAKYERFTRMKRNHNGKKYSVIVGFKKGGGSEDQAYRYSKDTWTADEARKHCKDHGGAFEAATGKEISVVCPSCGETLTFTEPAKATQPEAEPSSIEPEAIHSQLKRIADALILN